MARSKVSVQSCARRLCLHVCGGAGKCEAAKRCEGPVKAGVANCDTKQMLMLSLVSFSLAARAGLPPSSVLHFPMPPCPPLLTKSCSACSMCCCLLLPKSLDVTQCLLPTNPNPQLPTMPRLLPQFSLMTSPPCCSVAATASFLVPQSSLARCPPQPTSPPCLPSPRLSLMTSPPWCLVAATASFPLTCPTPHPCLPSPNSA